MANYAICAWEPTRVRYKVQDELSRTRGSWKTHPTILAVPLQDFSCIKSCTIKSWPSLRALCLWFREKKAVVKFRSHECTFDRTDYHITTCCFFQSAFSSCYQFTVSLPILHFLHPIYNNSCESRDCMPTGNQGLLESLPVVEPGTF